MSSKEKTLEIYHNYLITNPELKDNETIILCLEGLGEYLGTPRDHCQHKHPKGRLGAVFAVIKEGQLYYTQHASTLPDDPMGDGKFNDGTPIPTIEAGIYKAYSKLHHRKPAMEVGLGDEEEPVIRNTGISSSSHINIHRRNMNDSNAFAWSTGCITVLEEHYIDLLDVMGINKDGRYQGSGHFIGPVIVDRRAISLSLQKVYQQLYGKYYSKVFNTAKS